MAMYLEHFGLSRAPFAMHPDPEFIYLSDQHSSAKAFLESSAFVNDSFFVITGSIGAGKTTLVEGFLSELPANATEIARINQTQLSPTGFLRLLLDELGLKAFKAKKPQLLARLKKYLAKCTRENIKVVVVVDEDVVVVSAEPSPGSPVVEVVDGATVVVVATPSPPPSSSLPIGLPSSSSSMIG